MVIHLLKGRATASQISDMLTALETYIKLAVDVDRAVAAGGGIFHADCEAVLLQGRSAQPSIWGADWVPGTGEVQFEAMINIRPRQDNPSMTVLDPLLRDRIREVVEGIFGGDKLTS